MGRKEILDILTAVKGQTTVVFSTHILSDVERICDRVVFLHDGRVVLDGSLSDIKRKRTDSYGIEFDSPADANKCATLFPDTEYSETTVTIKHTAGRDIIKTLAANDLTPTRFELLEPTLEDLFLETIK